MKNYLLYTLVAIWNEPPRARQQIANELKLEGKVYFVERNKIGYPHIEISKAEDNVIVITPYYPIDYRVRYRVSFINRTYSNWLLGKIKELNLSFEFVMTFDYTTPAIHRYFSNVIFYCADDNVGFGNFNPGWVNKYHTAAEQRVAQSATLCIVTSDYMGSKIGSYNPKTYVVPLGAPRIPLRENVENVAHKDMPSLGLVGYLDNNLDDELLKKILTEFDTTLIGPVKEDSAAKLAKYPKAKLAGVKTGDALYECLSRIDVCIAPYDVNKLNKGATPNKMWLYLALGKPAVITNMPNIEKWQFEEGLVYRCTNDKFIENIIQAYKDDNPKLAKKRMEVAANSTWQKRVDEIKELYYKSYLGYAHINKKKQRL